MFGCAWAGVVDDSMKASWNFKKHRTTITEPSRNHRIPQKTIAEPQKASRNHRGTSQCLTNPLWNLNNPCKTITEPSYNPTMPCETTVEPQKASWDHYETSQNHHRTSQCIVKAKQNLKKQNKKKNLAERARNLTRFLIGI